MEHMETEFGSATVIQYLINNKQINENEFKDFFKEVDDKLISYIFYNDISSINFTTGLAGYLAYCYHRIESLSLNELDKLKMEEAIINCITRIYLKLSEKKKSDSSTILNEEHLSEYIKILSIINVCKKFNVLISYINKIEVILLNFIRANIANCKDIVAIIEFYNFSRVSNLENINLDITKIENLLSTRNITLNQIVFSVFILKKLNLKNASRLIKKLDNMIKLKLKTSLNNIYPYQIIQKRVNVGFWEGASMCPILSLIQKNNNHDLAILYGIL